MLAFPQPGIHRNVLYFEQPGITVYVSYFEQLAIGKIEDEFLFFQIFGTSILYGRYVYASYSSLWPSVLVYEDSFECLDVFAITVNLLYFVCCGYNDIVLTFKADINS